MRVLADVHDHTAQSMGVSNLGDNFEIAATNRLGKNPSTYLLNKLDQAP